MRKFQPISISAFSMVLCLMLLAPHSVSGQAVIEINSQEEFDHIDSLLEAALHSGNKAVDVVFAQKTFYFHEDHIKLRNLAYPEASIRFRGCATVVTSGCDSATLPYQMGYVDGLRDVDPWSPVYYTDRLVEVVDTISKLCRIYAGENAFADCQAIILTQWYYSNRYPVVRVADGYLYFVANDMEVINSEGLCTVNYDNYYNNTFSRYKLLLPQDSSVHWCTNSCFLWMENCSFAQLDISNISFAGNSDGSHALIELNDVRASTLKIHDCHFSAVHSDLLNLNATSNVTFCNNYVTDCYKEGVYSDNASFATIVEYNYFSECGKYLDNTFCVTCKGSDYHVAYNTFKNFGYGAVGLGLWYKTPKVYPCNGVVEHNVIFYDLDYFLNYQQHTLMDGGAIYVWTQNDNAVITHNLVHHYVGMADNRGIFLDDGACNVMVYENMVLHIPNSFCIDSRRVKSVETQEGSQVRKANVGNTIENNFVDGKIRFEQ